MNELNPSDKMAKAEDLLKITPEIEEKISELVRNSRVTEAIELYCLKKNCGIEEAQEGVNAIAEKHDLSIPRKTKMGCMTVVLILVSLVTLALFVMLYLAEHFNL